MGETIRGAGDIIAKATKFIGVQPCEACKKRQEKLNQLFPIKVKQKIREMTPDELKAWRDFQATRSSLRLTSEQAKFVCKIYSDVFQVPYFQPCTTCDAAPYIKMIEKMDKVVSAYNEE